MSKWSDPERVTQAIEATAKQIQELEAQRDAGTGPEDAEQQLETLRQRERQLEAQAVVVQGFAPAEPKRSKKDQDARKE